MLTAARSIILGDNGIKTVRILDRTPRFDVKSVDNEYGNTVYMEGLEKSNVKDQIVIASHSLPAQFQENLYGHLATQTKANKPMSVLIDMDPANAHDDQYPKYTYNPFLSLSTYGHGQYIPAMFVITRLNVLHSYHSNNPERNKS